MRHVPEEKYKLAKSSRYFDPSTPASCKAVAHARQEAIVAMTHDHVHDTFPCTQKRSEPHGA